MNIRDVIASCTFTKKNPQVVDDIEDILLAISSSNVPQVASYTKKYNHLFLRNQRVVNAFFENFTPELGDLLLNELSFKIIEKSIDIGINIPLSFWKWLAQQNHPNLINEVFEWATFSLVAQGKTEFEQNYAYQFRQAYIQHSPKAKTEIVSKLIPRLNDPCVLRWRPEDWDIFKSFTENQFVEYFSNKYNPEVLMSIENTQGLLALQTCFDKLPLFESAFNTFFASNQTDYESVCLQLTSSEGIQKSPGFCSLDAQTQKDFLNDLKTDFEGDDDNDEECGVLIGRYKHILNYTAEELFLKRFGEPNQILMGRMHIGNTTAMQNLFDKKMALSSLHALGEQSPHILLKMNKKMGKDIAQCLNDGIFLLEFFENISGKTFGKILNRFPDLLQWRDEQGNSLGHWAAVFKAIEDDWFDAVIKHPNLLEHNNIGHSMRDIMQHDIDRGLLSNTDEVAYLDKIILMREMGNTPHTVVSSKRKI